MKLDAAKKMVEKEVFKYLDKNIWQLYFMRSFVFLGTTNYHFCKKTNKLLCGVVRINIALLEACNRKQILDIVRHEIAHAILNVKEKRIHGKEFKTVCKMLGTSEDKAKTAISLVIPKSCEWTLRLNDITWHNIGWPKYRQKWTRKAAIRMSPSD